MSKLVSIIIPTYKRPNMLSRTIDTALNQSYKNIEIIVVDDNNEDTYRYETENIMLEYKNNSKIKYIKHEKNRGGCAARNTGMSVAKGDYICFLDDDDIIYPQKIEEQVIYLESNPSVGIVYCNRKVNNYIHCPSVEGDISYYLLSGDSIVITVMLLFRSEIINGIKWNTNLKRNQEAGFLLDLMNKNNVKIGKLDKVLCESDMSDRKNSLDSVKNEAEMLNYLKEYTYVIDILQLKNRNIDRKIYSHRYFGIALYHIKAHKIKNGLNALKRSFIYSPSAYIKHSCKYITMKISKTKNDYKKVIE